MPFAYIQVLIQAIIKNSRITTHDERPVVSCPPKLGLTRQITQKYKKI